MSDKPGIPAITVFPPFNPAQRQPAPAPRAADVTPPQAEAPQAPAEPESHADEPASAAPMPWDAAPAAEAAPQSPGAADESNPLAEDDDLPWLEVPTPPQVQDGGDEIKAEDTPNWMDWVRTGDPPPAGEGPPEEDATEIGDLQPEDAQPWAPETENAADNWLPGAAPEPWRSPDAANDDSWRAPTGEERRDAWDAPAEPPAREGWGSASPEREDAWGTDEGSAPAEQGWGTAEPEPTANEPESATNGAPSAGWVPAGVTEDAPPSAGAQAEVAEDAAPSTGSQADHSTEAASADAWPSTAPDASAEGSAEDAGAADAWLDPSPTSSAESAAAASDGAEEHSGHELYDLPPAPPSGRGAEPWTAAEAPLFEAAAANDGEEPAWELPAPEREQAEPGAEWREPEPEAPAAEGTPAPAPAALSGPFGEVADRLQAIADALRSDPGGFLAGAQGGGDPLGLLVAGFVLGYRARQG